MDNSAEIQNVKSLIIDILKKDQRVKPKTSIYLEFFTKYPGICQFEPGVHDKDIKAGSAYFDADDNYFYYNVNHTVAPCITKELCTDMGDFEANLEKYNVSSNMSMTDILYLSKGTQDTIFGEYTFNYIKCPDHIDGCETLHSVRKLEITPKHIEMRKQINSKVWKYDELLSLWQIFYAERMNLLTETIYELHFALHINTYINAINNIYEINEKQNILKNEIEKLIITDKIYKYWWFI